MGNPWGLEEIWGPSRAGGRCMRRVGVRGGQERRKGDGRGLLLRFCGVLAAEERGKRGKDSRIEARGRPVRKSAVVLAKSKKHRKSEFGEWAKACGMELGAEDDRDEGKLRERIRYYARTWRAGETWELRAEKNRLCVCVCACPFENR